MKQKLYLATKDGYDHVDGAQIFALGVFNNKEQAKETGGRITELVLNEEYPLSRVNGEGMNSKFLGGYLPRLLPEHHGRLIEKIREYATPDYKYHGCGGEQLIVELDDVIKVLEGSD